MEFESIKCTYAFYDEETGGVYYAFKTIPEIDHGEWAISGGGDSAWDLMGDYWTQEDFPEELLLLVEHIPEDIEIDGLEEE